MRSPSPRHGRVLSALLAVPLAAAATIGAQPDRLPDLEQVEPDRELLEDGYHHFVVQLRSEDRRDTADALRERLAARPGVVDVRRVSPSTVSVTTELTAREVFAFPEVGSVRRDTIVDVATSPVPTVPTDPSFGQQWPLHNTGANVPGLAATPGADVSALDAWRTANGGGAVVAVIDSAVALDHPDLAGRIWSNTDEVCGNRVDDDRNGYVDDCRGWDFTDGDATTYDPAQGLDTARHGTHVAGTIAAAANGIGVRGVAPGATVMPLTALVGGSGWTSWSTAAIRYAVDNGADVINMSLGGSSRDPVQQAALDYAASRGVLVVAAAGNARNDNDATPFFPAASPSESVLAVAASDTQDRLASFSNYGATSVDLAAPGSYVLSTLPGGGYGYLSGTSMAAPHVAGAAALLLGADPDLTLGELRAALLDSTDRVPALAGRTVTGGRLDVGRAVDRVRPAVAFTVAGLEAARPGAPIAASVTALADPSALPAGRDLAYRATVGALVDGEVYAVTQLPVVASGRAGTTDAAGTVPLGDAFTAAGRPGLTTTGDVLPLGMTLPQGEYALVLELVDAGRPEVVVGRPAVVQFAVGDEPVTAPPAGPGATAPPVTAVPGTPTAPVPVAPRPGAPVPGAPAPGAPAAPTPTAPVPAAPVPSAPAPGGAAPAPVAGPGPAPVRTPAPPAAAAPAPRTPGAPPPTTAPAPGDGRTGPPARGTAPALPVPGPTPPAPAPHETAPGSAAPAPVHTVPGGTPRFGITSVSPATGSTGGRDVVVLTGTRLPRGARVLIGGAAAEVLFDSAPSRLSVRTPAHVAGTVDLRVFGPDGSSDVVAGGFTYLAPAAAPGTRPAPAPGTPAPAPRPSSPAPAPTTPAPTAPAPIAPAPTTPDPGDPDGTRSAPSSGSLALVRPAAGSPLTRVSPSSWSAQTCHSVSCAALPV